MTRDRMNQLLESASRHLIQNYRQQPIILARGEGCRALTLASGARAE